MESFFSTFKVRPTNRSNYRSREHARTDVFAHIERLYNPRRRHSTLGLAESSRP